MATTVKYLGSIVRGRASEVCVSKAARLSLAKSLTELAGKLFFIPLSHLIAELYVGLNTHWSTYIISSGCLLVAVIIKIHALKLIDLACAESEKRTVAS